jgi:CTP-dependent riboflavin kinase
VEATTRPTSERRTSTPIVVEIASEVKLRDEFNLADGDEISVEIEG